MSKNKYYPNNWSAINSAPDEMFPTIAFEEFMEWKVGGWEMPSTVACMIRTQNLDTGKVKEYTYQRAEFARRKVRKLMNEGECDITVCTHDAVHFIYPDDEEFQDDDE